MDLASDVAELALDRRMHVLVGGIDRVDRRQLVGHLGELGIVEDPGFVQAARVQERRLQVIGQQLGVVGAQESPHLRCEARRDASGPERQIDHPSCASIARESWMSLIWTASWPIRSAAVKAVALRSMLSRSGS